MGAKITEYNARSSYTKDGVVINQTSITIFTATKPCQINLIKVTNIGETDAVGVVACYNSEDELYRRIFMPLVPEEYKIALEKYALMGTGDYMVVRADSNDVIFDLHIAEED